MVYPVEQHIKYIVSDVRQKYRSEIRIPGTDCIFVADCDGWIDKCDLIRSDVSNGESKNPVVYLWKVHIGRIARREWGKRKEQI